jgi:hypothetical protein
MLNYYLLFNSGYKNDNLWHHTSSVIYVWGAGLEIPDRSIYALYHIWLRNDKTSELAVINNFILSPSNNEEYRTEVNEGLRRIFIYTVDC